MRKLRTALIILLALAWVPLTSHCKLESLPGWEFLRCASEAPLTPEEGDPCDEDGCCAVEFAKYQSSRQQEIAPVLLLGILPADPLGALDPLHPVGAGLGIPTSLPPELPVSWQFSLRAALPVRAPSLAS